MAETKMKTRYKIIFIILIGIGLAISFQFDLLYVPLFVPANSTDIEIKLEKTACYGPCPVYSVIIYGDGTVLYDGINHVDNIGKNTYHIAKDDVDDLVELIYDVNYFSLKDRYEASHTDDSTIITSVKINDDEKTVVNYGHYGPDRLHKIEKKIDDLTNFILFLKSDDLPAKISSESKGEHFCAYIGFEKYPDNLFAEFLENPYNQDVTFLNFTYNDFKPVPEFYAMILEADQMNYPLNKRVRFDISTEDLLKLKEYLEQRPYNKFTHSGETLLDQIGTRDIDGNYRHPDILIDGNLYGVNGLNYSPIVAGQTETLNVQLAGTLEKIKDSFIERNNSRHPGISYFEINENDKIHLKTILDAIDKIQKSNDKIHLSEDVGGGIQDKTQNFFLKQNKIQFDNDESKYTHYFILNDTLYETSFVIC